MAATPQRGTMTFVGMRTGLTYSKEFYLSDVANALVTFDAGQGSGASSPTEWRPPETCVLNDVSIITGTADTTKIQLTRNGVPTGDIFLYTLYLSTLNNRPPLQIIFGAGDVIRANQLA